MYDQVGEEGLQGGFPSDESGGGMPGGFRGSGGVRTHFTHRYYQLILSYTLSPTH